jgi:PAS domain S-box-containing protein
MAAKKHPKCQPTRKPMPTPVSGAAIWDTGPVMLDVIAVDGETILLCNTTQAIAVGYEAKAMIGQPASRFYLRESLERLRALAAQFAIGSREMSAQLQLRRRDGQPLPVAASLDIVEWPGQGLVLRTAKTPLDPALGAAEQALRENEILRGIISTSKDALWCIEFAEPVDLTAPLPEVIRQFFENACYWRLCNRAMASFYKLPENMDFNETHVRATFPRNAENEAFARRLIEHGFNIDGAPALDRRLDGIQAHVENDVRGHIADGMLHRMWGSTRDLSEQKRKEQALASRLDETVEVLSAVPDPILVIGRDGLLEAANPAVEWRFGWPIDEVLGRPAGDLVRFPQGFDSAMGLAGIGVENAALPVTILTADGHEHPCRAHLSALGDMTQGRRVVLILRPEAAIAPNGSRRARNAGASR